MRLILAPLIPEKLETSAVQSTHVQFSVALDFNEKLEALLSGSPS
jgi:hypothetical protein